MNETTDQKTFGDFSIASLLLCGFLSAGLSFSGLLQSGHVNLLPFLFSFIGILLFFLTEKAMNKKASENEKIINIFRTSMFVIALLVGFFFSLIAGTIYLLITVYLWNSYHGFYIAPLLKRHILFKEFLESLIFIPVALFPVALGVPDKIFSPESQAYAFMICSSFFIYKICRRLDPKTFPDPPAPIHFYGYRTIFYCCLIALLISVIGADVAGMKFILWPLLLTVFFSLVLVLCDSSKFFVAEKVTEFAFYFQVWAGTLPLFISFA